MDEYEKLLGPKTKLVAITHMSNALGTINPVKDIIRLAHDEGVPVLLDGCQEASRIWSVDVQDLDVDFYAFSGHKLYGPTGVGVLYGKAEILEGMPPYQGGGDMIARVTFEETTFKGLPHRFEAGTPAIVEVIGLGAALEYLMNLGLDRIAAHEHDVLTYATELLSEIPGVRIYWHIAAQGQHPFIHAGRCPSSRCRNDHRPGRRRGQGRASLRPAPDGLL